MNLGNHLHDIWGRLLQAKGTAKARALTLDKFGNEKIPVRLR